MRKITLPDGTERYVGVTAREAILLAMESNSKGERYNLPNTPLVWRGIIRSCARLGIVPNDGGLCCEDFIGSPSEPAMGQTPIWAEPQTVNVSLPVEAKLTEFRTAKEEADKNKTKK